MPKNEKRDMTVNVACCGNANMKKRMGIILSLDGQNRKETQFFCGYFR